MKIKRSHYIVFLQSSLLFSISTVAQSLPSLNTLIMELEKNHTEEISVFSNSIATQTFSTNPKYQNYGGELGNKYFQYYTKEVIAPALNDYFIALKKSPKEISDEKNLFVDFIDVLGKFRQKIAIVTRSKDPASFGKRTNTLNEVISNDAQDPSWISWFKHLQQYFGIDTLNFSSSFRLPDILDNIDQFIRSNKSRQLTTKNERTFLDVSNANNIYTGAYNIEPNINSEITAAVKIYNKNNLQFTFFHAIALYNNLSRLFFDALDPNLRQDQLLERIGRFFYYWSQAAIFAQGQAAIGEWIIHSIAQSAGYKLIFSEAWRGKENGSMAPNMYASSYLDESEFMEQFLANAGLKTLPSRN